MTTQEMAHMTEDGKRVTELKKIVVGHDFSDIADRAFADAMALAARFNGEIIVAHAQDSNFSATTVYRNDQQVQEEMHQLINRIAEAGYPSKEIVRSGTPAATLCDVVDEEDADLLIVGAYGNGSQERATLGSTAELLLRSIPCPVLTYGPTFIWLDYSGQSSRSCMSSTWTEQSPCRMRFRTCNTPARILPHASVRVTWRLQDRCYSGNLILQLFRAAANCSAPLF